QVPGDHVADGFAQKLAAKIRARQLLFDRFSKASRQSHLFLLLSLLVFGPELVRRFDIHLLALLTAAAEQDHELLAVFSEIHPVSWPEVQPNLVYSGSHTFGLREVPQAYSE